MKVVLGRRRGHLSSPHRRRLAASPEHRCLAVEHGALRDLSHACRRLPGRRARPDAHGRRPGPRPPAGARDASRTRSSPSRSSYAQRGERRACGSAPSGWPLYLQTDSGINGDVHYFAAQPYAYVETEGATFNGWSEAFSHEIVEMLVDPTTARDYYDGESTIQVEVGGVMSTGTELDQHALEVADPVDERGYRLDGVYVTDFVLPAWFAGALFVPSDGCDPSQGVQCGPPIAALNAAGPYDEMGVLTGPWQTQWEIPDD